MTFGEKLKTLRVREEYSQEQLAALLHVSRQAVTKWENDAGLPDIENIKAVADLFDVTWIRCCARRKSWRRPTRAAAGIFRWPVRRSGWWSAFCSERWTWAAAV